MSKLFASDISHILDATSDLWEELRGRRIFISGGTGFFGCWLLESLLAANDLYGLYVDVAVLTRSPQNFESRSPHIAGHPAVHLLQGDVRSFEFPTGPFHYVIHAATEASAQLAFNSPLVMHSTIIEGTSRVLEFARASCVKKLLFTSSGAVYGPQPASITHVDENYLGAPDPSDPRSVYGTGKRAAEQLCSIYAAISPMECKIARCFAFVGPHLPLDSHFAIGNFIRDALVGGPIKIVGDGTPIRSYLYAADLAIWLWTILFRGQSCRPYNVGSESALSIADLAGQIATALDPSLVIDIAGAPLPGAIPARYTPSTRRIRSELGLQERITPVDAIQRTARWYRPCQESLHG